MISTVAATMMVGAASHAAAAAIAVDWGGNVYRIDEAAGTASVIGASGFTTTNSLASSGAGLIYAAAGYPLGSVADQLIRIDPLTGAGTLVVNLGLSEANYSIRALAFSPLDTLYAIVDESRSSTPLVGPDALQTVNLATGAMTRIGATGLSGMQGLDFASDGALYGWDVGAIGAAPLGLVTINSATGTATDVDTGVGGDVGIQTLSFSLDGSQLYGAGNGLYTVDVATGARTLVGAGWSYDIRGMATTPIPEPATALLLGLGLAGLTVAGRRR